MTPDATMALRQSLPHYEPFPYYRDRESAWLLQAHLTKDTPVRAIRQGAFAKLLDRPLIKPLAAVLPPSALVVPVAQPVELAALSIRPCGFR